VACKIGKLLRPTFAREIIRTCNNQAPVCAKSARYQARVRKPANPDREIDTRIHDIDKSIGEREFNRDFWKTSSQLTQKWNNMKPAENDWRIEPQ
jgi:hypothetical protein